MAIIKLTPLLLFLILLFVLVLSVLFSKWLPIATEGFTPFYYSSALGASIIIPQYSSTVHVYKVYDNIFFDPKNGNIIMITGPEYDSKVKTDDDRTGTSIERVSVIPRIPSPSGVVSTIDTKRDSNNIIIANVSTSLINIKLTSCYTSWTWTTSLYEIIYMPWNTSTFIQIIDIKTNNPISVSLFGSGSINSNYTYQNDKIPSIPTEYGGNDKTQIDAYIKDVFYDDSQSIYAVSDFVRFDATNGNLILQTGDGKSRKLSVYNSSGEERQGMGTQHKQYKLTSTPISSSRGFTPFVLFDTQGKNLVNYMTMSDKTMISLLAIDPNNSKNYILRKVVRFNPAVSGGIEVANTDDSDDDDTDDDDTDDTDDSDDSDDDSDDDEDDDDDSPSLDSIISDYYKQYWNSNSTQYSDDFLLKTQIIPPICPACSTSYGSGIGGAVGGTADGVGDAVGGIASGVGGAAGGALLGAGALGGGALMGAGALAGGVASGVGDAVGDVVGGAENVVGGVASGVGSAIGGIAGGIGSAIGGLGQPQQGSYYGQGQGQSYGQAYQGQPGAVQGATQGQLPQQQQGYIDNYSRYGALTSKGGNPVPVTSDFSKFGK